MGRLLGYTYLEKGEAAKAIALLEQALQHRQRLRRPQLQSWFMSYLGEAYLLHGDHAKAYDLGCQALTMNTDLGSRGASVLPNARSGASRTPVDVPRQQGTPGRPCHL